MLAACLQPASGAQHPMPDVEIIWPGALSCCTGPEAATCHEASAGVKGSAKDADDTAEPHAIVHLAELPRLSGGPPPRDLW